VLLLLVVLLLLLPLLLLLLTQVFWVIMPRRIVSVYQRFKAPLYFLL
jgi:hypothetical protein